MNFYTRILLQLQSEASSSDGPLPLRACRAGSSTFFPAHKVFGSTGIVIQLNDHPVYQLASKHVRFRERQKQIVCVGFSLLTFARLINISRMWNLSQVAKEAGFCGTWWNLVEFRIT